MDATIEELLFYSSDRGLELFLGTMLKKNIGKLRQGRKRRREKEIQRKTVRFGGENVNCWEDGVLLFCFSLEGRRSDVTRRCEG